MPHLLMQLNNSEMLTKMTMQVYFFTHQNLLVFSIYLDCFQQMKLIRDSNLEFLIKFQSCELMLAKNS